MKKLSLKDIAAAVGVAPSTVSFVLNGKGREMRISEALEKRVRAYAEKAGYHPNKIAVSLRTGNSKILGLIVEDISNNFFATLAKVIEKEAEKFGYNVVFCCTENDDRKGIQLLKILSQQQVDGFLITPTAGMCEDIRILHAQKQPMVLMDRNFPGLNVPGVLADNYNGVRLGMQHLIEQGFKNIGFVTVEMELVQMQHREQAYKDALTAAKIGKKRSYLFKVRANTSQEETVELISRFLSANRELDAVFFATNYLGIAGLESLRKLELTIPEQVAVVCFDDHDIFRLYSPGITTICQPIDDIGVHAVKLLVDRINASSKPIRKNTIEFAAKLIVRQSSINNNQKKVVSRHAKSV